MLTITAGASGLFMVGGGVPKNFVQDTVFCAEILTHNDVEMHKYAVQITVANVCDGACSSSTLKEACSWGKIGVAQEQMVFCQGDHGCAFYGVRRISPRRVEKAPET